MWSRSSETGSVSCDSFNCLGMSRFLFVDFFQSFEDPVGAGIDAQRRHVRPADRPFTIEHKQRPFAYAVTVAIHTVLPRDRPFWLEVGQEWEVELVVARVRVMAP